MLAARPALRLPASRQLRAFVPAQAPPRRTARRTATTAALSFANAPVEVLVAGGALLTAVVGYLGYEAFKAGSGAGDAPAAATPGRGPPPRKDAVLVFGASGRTGREIVKKLIDSGRNVVAAVRSADRARGVFEPLGLREGRQQGASGAGALFVDGGVDITEPATLAPELFAGVSQVVVAVGAVFGRAADGTMGYLDDLTPERVDALGVSNITAAAAAALPRAERSADEVLGMRSAEDIGRWQRLDDVIMGGQSDSQLAPAADGSGAVWTGTLRVEGGGFCGARTASAPFDLSGYDGIALRVRSDGQTFKLNIKTEEQTDAPENVFQATFDTPADGQWADVLIPWHEFVLVKRARSVPGGPALDPARIRQFGLVLSRFEYNGFPNPRYRPGPFSLELAGGISAYKDTRPQLVLVSSAGVERNARIGDDAEARKKDIPIVQLNPGGVLNHKYAGEAAVRASGLPYAVVRPTGLTNETEGAPFLLEAGQGDRISGRLSRDELASVVAAAAGSPAAAGKSFELRRGESADAKGVPTTPADLRRLLLRLAPDRLRPAFGLDPMPAVVPPPAPVTEERKKEILSDVRVVRSQLAGRGGRVRDEQETAAARSVTVTNDGREKVAPGSNSAEARAWIAAWRARQAQQGGAAVPAPVAKAAASGEQVPENVADAREWIRSWRAGRLESQLPADASASSSSSD